MFLDWDDYIGVDQNKLSSSNLDQYNIEGSNWKRKKFKIKGKKKGLELTLFFFF